jgi:hypothetical protein
MQEKTSLENNAIDEKIVKEASEQIMESIIFGLISEYVLTEMFGENCVKIEPAENPRDGILTFKYGTEKVIKNANLRFWRKMKKLFTEYKRFCDKILREIEEETKND